MNCLDFLRKILPTKGYYCATTISDRGARNRFFESVDQLADFVHDNRFTNVYHACSSFVNPSKRTQENAQYQRSLWMDIDVRSSGDNSYMDFGAAISAVQVLCKRASLPRPMVLFSGGGLHVYWLFDVDIPREQWLPYATGLKAACAIWGIRADPHRTADAASILRPLDTINPKHSKNVALVQDAKPSPITRFVSLLTYNTKPKERAKYELVDCRPVFAGCNQMREFAAGTTQTEPVWRACGTILAQCEQGGKLWHACSQKDARYDYEESELKWNGIVKFDNATTCKWFKDNNPRGCEGCAFSGTTPVQLGRKVAPTVAIEPDELPKLPYPYEYGENNCIVLCKKPKSENAEIERTAISKFPIVIDNVFTGESAADRYHLGIRTHTPLEGWRSFNISLLELSERPDAVLAKCIIPAVHTMEIQKYISRMHESHKMNTHAETIFDTFGWKSNGTFLLGEWLLSLENGQGSMKKVLLGNEAKPFAKALRPGGARGFRSGGLEAWRAAAQSLFAPGHEWQAVTLITAAAAPLLAFSTDPEGGVILSLSDNEGGKGKTTATLAGASIWGDFVALNSVPGDTLNARFAKIATLGNIPTFFDEQGRDSAKIANEFVKTFTVGREKERLNRNGEKTKTPRTWKTILITNANNELAGAIRSDTGSAAMADRVLEISVEPLPLDKRKLSSEIKNAFIENAGYAGPIIIFLFLRNMAYIKSEMPKKINYYNSLLGSTKDRFLALHLAAFDVCARILERSELITFSAQEIIDYAIDQAKGGSIENAVPLTNEELLSLFLRMNIDKTLVTKKFIPNTHQAPVQLPRGELRIRRETDTKEIVTTRKHIDEFLVERRRSPKEFLRELEKSGVLKSKIQRRNLGAGTHYSTGQEYVLIFDASHPNLEEKVDVAIAAE